jgi:hypothetical protein
MMIAFFYFTYNAKYYLKQAQNNSKSDSLLHLYQ